MGSQNQGKLNWLQRNLPEGLVVDSGWFECHGVSRQLRRKYVMNGWLLSLRAVSMPARSVRHKRNRSLAATRDLAQRSAEPAGRGGGRTALELQGFAHYVAASGPREAHLYATKTCRDGSSHVPVDTKLVLHNARRLFRNARNPAVVINGGDRRRAARGRGSRSNRGDTMEVPLTMSTPERAILELLDEVPKRETFHQADMLMEGLRNLSPRRLQALLADCRNVKVKRLFLWFAERHNHAWLQKLDRSGIDLGKGKRMLVRGGKLDPKYNITVPENLDGGRLKNIAARPRCWSATFRSWPKKPASPSRAARPSISSCATCRGSRWTSTSPTCRSRTGRLPSPISMPPCSGSRSTIREGIRGAQVTSASSKRENIINKLFVGADGVQIKIEVTPVLRGCVYEPETRSVSQAVEDQFGFAEIQVVSFADLYAGKLVAALDRQHPRDLFDVRDLLANEGIGDDCARPSSSTSSAITGRWRKSWRPPRLDISQEFARASKA